MPQKNIRIATRSSPLALWQANAVKQQLEAAGHSCELVLIESTGDLQLAQPIYALGISGVFTKQLDVALINKQADIAVHSLKDVPTQLAENIFLAAVLKRGAHQDVVVIKRKEIWQDYASVATVATSSLRRRAQWLARYGAHKTVPIRGNVQTRLKKFAESAETDAVIFAKAGLERLNLLSENCYTLDWMIPAPAQGIIGVVCRGDDEAMKEVCAAINHEDSFRAGFAERQFLKTLLGGCSVPISALALIHQGVISFKGAIHTYDGSKGFEVYRETGVADWQVIGSLAAKDILRQEGAVELLEEIRKTPWKDESSIN